MGATETKQETKGIRLPDLAILLVVLTFIAYSPALRAGFIWDDDTHVTQNSAIRSLHGLRQIWFEPQSSQQYYPLQLTVFWVEYHLWGLQPFGYHFVNVLLHALNAFLLWRVLQQLEVRGAFLAAMIFAVHPVGVESVAWITELKNVLSCTFYLLAMLAYFRFRPLVADAASDSCTWRSYLQTVGLFLCAMFSKTVACSFPAVILLLTWWKRGRVEKRDLLATGPMFILGAGMGLVTAWLEKHHAMAGGEWSLSFLQRCLLAGRSLWFYAGKLVWPTKLAFIYPRWDIDPAVWWQYAFSLAALGVLASLWLMRQRLGKGPVVAVLIFAGTLFPALGFFDVFPFRYSFVADHFQYLASAGLIALFASGVTTAWERAGRFGRQVGAVAAPVGLLTLGALTWRQTGVYGDIETLWRDTLVKNPNAWIAHNNLASILARQGHTPEAITEYRASLRLNPRNVEAHTGLGAALGSQGKIEEAIAEIRTAVQLRPDFADAHENLGHALALQGNIKEAIAEYWETLRLRPNSAKVLARLAAILATDQDASIRNGAVAVQLAERLCGSTRYRQAEAMDVLAAAYAEAGRFTDAVRVAQQAVELATTNGQWELAAQIENRLHLYQAGRPFHESPAPSSKR